MIRISRRLLAVAAVSMFAVGGAFAETVKEVLDRIEPKAKAVKSAELEMEITNSSEYMEMKSQMKSWMKRDGELMRNRVESKSTMTMKTMDMKQETETLMVDAKDFRWSEVKAAGTHTVSKMPAAVPAAPFEALRTSMADGVAEVKAPEELDGEKCAVIAIKAKGESGESVTTWWLGEDTGLMRKMVMEAPQMGTTTTRVTAFRSGVDVPDSKFEYTPPEGVQVMDMTGAGGVPKVP